MIKNIAVTGTKGKSTVLRLLESGFRNLNYRVYGTYGIDGFFYEGEKIREGNTCKDYISWDKELYPTDAHLVEATSFILDNDYMKEFEADCVLFTSFDESEHTEIHDEEGSYLQSKKKIFKLLKKGSKAIICRDIENFDEIVNGIACEYVTYGFHPEADYVLGINMLQEKKMVFSLTYNDKTLFFKTILLGRFNALNMAAAFITCLELELPNIKFFRGLEQFSGFPGRLERYCTPENDNKIIIDYAHTYKSLEELLNLCKEIYPEREIVTVFGCGGDKSREKRPLMGKVAEKFSDHIIITNDNPRSEAPMDIAMEIFSNIEHQEKAHIILDRNQAIKTALSNSHGALIVIAGKGAEMDIRINDIELFHNDTLCLQEWCLQNNLRLVSMITGEALNENF